MSRYISICWASCINLLHTRVQIQKLNYTYVQAPHGFPCSLPRHDAQFLVSCYLLVVFEKYRTAAAAATLRRLKYAEWSPRLRTPMMRFHVQFIECNALQLSCNNSTLSNMVESTDKAKILQLWIFSITSKGLQLLHKNAARCMQQSWQQTAHATTA